MRFLDLCAGIGGFSLGLERAGMNCAGQVEIDPFCTKVLEKHWPQVPRWKDISNAQEYSEYPAVDLVCGGYPCQPFSHAGKRQGAADDRHLWPNVFAIVQQLRPAWCLFENVAGHVSLGLDEVLSNLESIGYACQALVIPACSVDAPHRRDRVWILAHAECAERRPPESGGHDADRNIAQRQETTSGVGASGAHGRGEVLADAESFSVRTGLRLPEQTGDGRGQSGDGSSEVSLFPESTSFRRGEGRSESEGLKRQARTGGNSGNVSHPDGAGRNRGQKTEGLQARRIVGGESERVDSDAHIAGCKKLDTATITKGSGFRAGTLDPVGCFWPAEPDVGRVAHGIPRRVDRLKSLGNAVVPPLVEAIGLAIMAADYR